MRPVAAVKRLIRPLVQALGAPAQEGRVREVGGDIFRSVRPDRQVVARNPRCHRGKKRIGNRVATT